MLARPPVKGSDHEYGITSPQAEIKRTTNLPFINLKPIPNIRHPTPWNSIVQFVLVFQYPVVDLAVITYCFSWYWWITSIMTMVPAAYPMYIPSIQGLLFIGLLLGTLFAELACSGTLSDWIVHKLRVRNEGIQVAETRLWLAYPGALLSGGKFPSPQAE
jgi:hypothetical protein